jgi:hypothetical protein
MPKRKTTIHIQDGLWREWVKFVVDRTGSARKASQEIENAMKEYIERHREDSKEV